MRIFQCQHDAHPAPDSAHWVRIRINGHTFGVRASTILRVVEHPDFLNTVTAAGVSVSIGPWAEIAESEMRAAR